MSVAQQLIDASEQGGEAFLAFAIMVFLFTGSLFYMDRIRRRREERDSNERRESSRRARGCLGGGFDRSSMSSSVWARLGNKRLVAARREVHAAVEQAVEELRVRARGRRPWRPRSCAPARSRRTRRRACTRA